MTKLNFTIRDTTTGEERTYRDDYEWKRETEWDDHDFSGAVYMWTDGNYGCDCNRHLFFERAARKDDFPEDISCGTGRFELVKVVDEHGTDRTALFEGRT